MKNKNKDGEKRISEDYIKTICKSLDQVKKVCKV